MACLMFLDLGTADVAPWWVTLLFLLLWVVLFARGDAVVRAVPTLGAVASAVGVRRVAGDDRPGDWQLGWG